MFGEHIISNFVRTPVAARLLGFMKIFDKVQHRCCPEWCERRYGEAWPFRPVSRNCEG